MIHIQSINRGGDPPSLVLAGRMVGGDLDALIAHVAASRGMMIDIRGLAELNDAGCRDLTDLADVAHEKGATVSVLCPDGGSIHDAAEAFGLADQLKNPRLWISEAGQ